MEASTIRSVPILEKISLNDKRNYLMTDSPKMTSENDNKVIEDENIDFDKVKPSNEESKVYASDSVKKQIPLKSLGHKAKKKERNNNQFNKRKTIALFIGGLDSRITADTLKKFLWKYRSITSIKICSSVETKASLGHGYINLESVEEAENLTEEYNYKKILDSEIKIMPSLRNAVYRKNIGTNVFFSNLPLEDEKLTTRVFYEEFRKYGKILSCKLDKRKNIGFVYFEDDKVAKDVIFKYNQSKFYGNKILCGLHFDKELRNFPEFDRKKSNLDKNIILENELLEENATQEDRECGNTNLTHTNTIFIKNLPLDTTDDEILEYFSTIGPVKAVYKTEVTKYNSKWAFVTYKRPSDVALAIKDLNEKPFRERTLSVTKAKPKKKEVKHNQPLTLWLENLSSVCDQKFLTILFEQEKITLLSWKVNNYKDGYGTFSGVATFRNTKDLEKAHKLINGKLIGGSVIKSSLSSPGVKDFSAVENGRENPALNPSYVPVISSQYDIRYWNDSDVKPPENSNYSQKHIHEVVNSLKKQVKKALFFLKLSYLLKDNIVEVITNYLISVFWCGDLNSLSKFLLLLNTNVHYETVLQRQIEETIKNLGMIK